MHEEWFVPLSCVERGIVLQLFIIAKIQGDTGTISYRSLTHFAQDLGVERRTLGRTLAKFTTSGRIITRSDTPELISIFIPKYRQYQDLSNGRLLSGDGWSTGKNTTLKRTEAKRNELNGLPVNTGSTSQDNGVSTNGDDSDDSGW